QSATVALGQAKAEVIRIGEYACKGLEETQLDLTSKDPKHSELGMQVEGALNNLERQITDYLISVSKANLSEVESKEHSILLDTDRDIDRIGDHYKNIIELIDYKKSNKIIITDNAQEDLQHMFEWTISTVQLAVRALDKMDEEAATKVIEMEKEIDRFERDNRKRHIIRMNKGLCDG